MARNDADLRGVMKAAEQDGVGRGHQAWSRSDDSSGTVNARTSRAGTCILTPREVLGQAARLQEIRHSRPE